MDKILIKRGTKEKLEKSPPLSQGELFLAKDEERLYVGGPKGNIPISTKKEVDEINERLTQTVDDLSDRGINVMYPPAPYQAAKGDGVTDDSDAIRNLLNINGKIFLPEGYSFLIGSTIRYHNKQQLKISGGGTIILKKDIKAFDIFNVENLQIDGIFVDCSDQHGNSHERNVFLEGDQIEYANINKVFMKDGAMGIRINNVKNYILSSCMADNFSGWAFYSGGYLENVIWKNNISTNGSYDGLKMTGVLKNAIVTENICIGNSRDGFDFAGHSVENLKVFDNIFSLNHIAGVEIKLLDRDEYPLPSDLTDPVYKNIEVYNNTLDKNGLYGITMNNIYEEVPTKNVEIKHNNIIGFETRTDAYGMRLHFIVASEGDVLVEYNNIEGHERGIRLINSEKIVVRRNNIRSFLRCVTVENQGHVSTGNLIEKNNLTSLVGNCVHLDNVEGNIVRYNDWESPSGQYKVNLEGLSDNYIFDNITKDAITTTTPSRRGIKGEIILSADKVESGCLGWIATNTGPSATWIPFGRLST